MDVCYPKNEGSMLEIKLPSVWHMSRPKFCYLDPPKSVLKPTFSNISNLPSTTATWCISYMECQTFPHTWVIQLPHACILKVQE
jgi:hypothetical protein